VLEYYAHSKEGVFELEWKTLEDHLFEVATLSKKFASSFGAGECGWTAGILHDVGKYTEEFHNYLVRSTRGEGVRRGVVIHALQGAKYIEYSINNNLLSDIIGNVIANHHGGLFDNITGGERTLTIRTNKDEEKIHFSEVINKFSPKINEVELREEIVNLCRISQERKINPYFMLHLLTKALFSCVVDADRCNSAGMTIRDTIPDWETLINQLEIYLEEFSATSDIDKIRKNISEQCKQGSVRQQGIYTLSLPTGGGKTLSSLRFALEHGRM
jgi:CRISPR-associated endonuclease/helicase Cas3